MSTPKEENDKLEPLAWALRFMQEYEKKLLKRAINIAKVNRYNRLEERMKLNGDE